jgi:hypothetical protein
MKEFFIMSLIYQVIQEKSTVDSATIGWSDLYPEKFDTMLSELYNLGLMYFTFSIVSPNIVYNILHFTSAESFQQYEIGIVSLPEYIERTEYERQNGISRRIISQEYID